MLHDNNVVYFVRGLANIILKQGGAMTITGAEIKVGVDILSRVFKSIKGMFDSKKEKDILSKIYKELLLGGKADLEKVEALLLQVEKLGSSSTDYVRAKGYLENAKVAAKKPAAKKPGGKFAAKKPAAKKPAAKKPSPRVVSRTRTLKTTSKRSMSKASTKKR